MNRLVYSVFKAIMMAIIFVFVFDMAFYLYRAISLNSRMQSISTSLQKVVMENNYLPSETATMYQHLFGQLIEDFNGGSYSIGADGSLNLNDSDINNNFISNCLLFTLLIQCFLTSPLIYKLFRKLTDGCERYRQSIRNIHFRFLVPHRQLRVHGD